MSNPKVEYNNYIRANLPAGITYDSTRNQYVTGNGKRFVTYKEAKWYLDYIIKFGYSPLSEYAANGFEPKFVADFAENYFRVDGDTSSFNVAFEPTATTNGTMVDSDGLPKWRPHNKMASSNDVNSSWVLNNFASTTDNLLIPDTSTSYHHISQNASSAVYAFTWEFEAKPEGYNFVRLFNAIIGIGVDIDLANKTFSNKHAELDDPVITDAADGYVHVKCQYIGTRTNKTFALQPMPSALQTAQFAGDGTSGVRVRKMRLYRSDLGGMVNNPDTGDSYVPTTTSAVYLPRRNHHIYNGSAWVNEGILTEPSTQTNKPHANYSTPKNGSTDVTGLTISDDAGVGFTGAGTGPRVTGSGSSGTQRMNLGGGDATYRSTAQVYIAKSSTHKYYQIINSSDVNAYVNFDLNDGSLGNIGSAWSADGIVSVVDHETFYELIVNDTVAAAVPRYLYFVDSKTASWAASGATSDYGDIPYVGNIHQSGADNTFPALPIICNGSQVARAGEQLVIPHESISWPAGDELSIHIQGRMTGQNSEFVRWRLDASNYISLSSGTGDFTFAQSEGGIVDSVTGGSFTSGTNVSFNVASRNGSTFINGAVDGVALTEDATPTTFPDLETTDLQLAYSGGPMVIKEVSLWDVNITDAGTEDATDD